MLTVAFAAALIAGCGARDPQASGQGVEPSGTGSATASATADPTPPGVAETALPTDLGPPTVDGPNRPPRTPSDLVPTGIVVGTIRGGTTSCYTLETDDGDRYALLGVDGPFLASGDVVRMKIAPDRPAIAPCPGDPVTVVWLQIV
jgi:hypothetical protein